MSVSEFDESDGFRVDFTNVEVKDFEPVPTGRYLFVADDYETGEVSENAKNPGQPKVTFTFKIQEPVTLTNGRNILNKNIWCNFFPTLESTLFMLKGFMGALGYDVSGEIRFKPQEIMERSFDDRLFVAKAKFVGEKKNKDTGETYNAKNEINAFWPASTWTTPTT